MNDPIADLKSEYAEKKIALDAVKKDIKENPDERYLNRKELGAELKGLRDAICEHLNDGDEVVLHPKKRFKKSKISKVKYSKNDVYSFCSKHNLAPEAYDKEHAEEDITLKPI